MAWAVSVLRVSAVPTNRKILWAPSPASQDATCCRLRQNISPKMNTHSWQPAIRTSKHEQSETSGSMPCLHIHTNPNAEHAQLIRLEGASIILHANVVAASIVLRLASCIIMPTNLSCKHLGLQNHRSGTNNYSRVLVQSILEE